MKKLSIFILLFFGLCVNLKAECTYKEQRNLVTLASYVTSNYVYDSNTDSFTLTFENLTDRMKVSYNGDYKVTDGKVTIYGLKEGESVKANIKSTNEDVCSEYDLRVMTINLPYLNPYYGSEECEKRKTLSVCFARFLDYRLSEEQFKNLIAKNEIALATFPDDIVYTEEKPGFFQRILDFIKEIYIPAILLVVSGGITYLIFNRVYRKVKHGL